MNYLEIEAIEAQLPEKAPCGHNLSLFLTKTGSLIVITMRPFRTKNVTFSAAYWCNECLWISIDDDTFTNLDGRDFTPQIPQGTNLDSDNTNTHES